MTYSPCSGPYLELPTTLTGPLTATLFKLDGKAIANLSVATSESWKDKNTGEKVEKTEWHRVVLFGRLGEIAGEYLKKGSKVYLEGKLQTRKWQDKNGQDRYTTEIVGNELQMLDSASRQPSEAHNHGSAPLNETPPSEPDFDDDIPF